MPVRSTYLAVAEVALDLLAAPEVEAAWDQPSALAGWRVSGLCGHLARALITVEHYLDADAWPQGEMLTPGGYYAAAVNSADLDSDLHRAIRQRGDEMASAGLSSLREAIASSAARLRARLGSEPADRKVAVLAGIVLKLDDYLATRLVELVVHSDDVAFSVGIDTPSFPPAAYDIVTQVLCEVARVRHGDLAIVRALTRRERDESRPFPVF